MLVLAGRYLVAISSLVSPLLVIDFGAAVGGPALAASIDLGQRGKDLALDPERVRLYVLTRSLSGAQGWLAWLDAAFELHGPWHLEDDLGFPAGSAPGGIAYDRTSDRVLVGCPTGLFSCDPETLLPQESLAGDFAAGGFTDAWESYATVDGELWLPDGNTVSRVDTAPLAISGSWDTQSVHGVGLEAACS